MQGEHVTTAVPAPGSIRTLVTPDLSTQVTSTADLFVAAGWHQDVARRVSLTYLAGMAFRRQHDQITLTRHLTWFNPALGTTTPLIENDELHSTEYSAGIVTSIDVAWKISAHLAVVPQLRVVAANHEWSLRPGVAMRWWP